MQTTTTTPTTKVQTVSTLVSGNLPKLHNVTGSDELRPQMMNVYFHRNKEEETNLPGIAYFVATNAHVLTYFDASQYLSLEFILSLPESFYLSPKDYKKLSNPKVLTATYEEGSDFIKLVLKGGGIEILPLLSEEAGKMQSYIGKFPRYWNVLPTKDTPCEPLTEIGYNSEYLSYLFEIYGNAALKFKFHGSTRATLITPINPDSPKVETILMPVAIA